MKEKLIIQTAVIAAVIIISLLSLYPPLERPGPDGKPLPGKIRLGLDLKGGTYLVVQVMTDEAVAFRNAEDREALERELKEKAIAFESVKVADLKTIAVASIDPNKLKEFQALVAEHFPSRRVSVAPGPPASATLVLDDAQVKGERNTAVEQALETIRNRIDEFGVAEAPSQRLGDDSDRLALQFPGIDDPERIKDILRRTAVLDLKIVEAGPAPTKEELLAAYGGVQPPETVILESVTVKRTQDGVQVGTQERAGFYILRKDSVITGRDLKGATRGQDQFGMGAVNFSLKADGAVKFGRATRENLGKQLAIVLDGKVKSAPVIRAEITDRGEITGNFTMREADDLALVLRSGSLPASIRYLEERTVGPGLGMDSIREGLVASFVGFLVVLGFMVAWYKWSGVNAVVALTLNIVMMLAIMSWFKATMTLPGIAGYVLTVGMAVDANILVFERIREELRLGKSARTAIELGFDRAFSTIFDSHVTTLVAALFLFNFGSGPIRGFAVSLSAGIVASLFTAVYVSHYIYNLGTYFRGRETVSI